MENSKYLMLPLILPGILLLSAFKEVENKPENKSQQKETVTIIEKESSIFNGTWCNKSKCLVIQNNINDSDGVPEIMTYNKQTGKKSDYIFGEYYSYLDGIKEAGSMSLNKDGTHLTFEGDFVTSGKSVWRRETEFKDFMTKIYAYNAPYLEAYGPTMVRRSHYPFDKFNIDLEPGDGYSQFVIQVEGDKTAKYRAAMEMKTALTVFGEGSRYLTLEKWKHCKVNDSLITLPDNKFTFPSKMKTSCFPKVSIEEIETEVIKQGGEEWRDTLKNKYSIRDFHVDCTSLKVKLEKFAKKKWGFLADLNVGCIYWH